MLQSDLGQINLAKFNHNNGMITLSVITLSGFYCIIIWLFLSEIAWPQAISFSTPTVCKTIQMGRCYHSVIVAIIL